MSSPKSTQDGRKTHDVVFDTNIYISALFWKGPSYRLVQRALDGHLHVNISASILDEIDTVLERDFGIEKEKREGMIRFVLLFAQIVVPKEKVDIIKDDPDDNAILECALAAEATFVISQDKHLLAIGNYAGILIMHLEEFCTRFC